MTAPTRADAPAPEVVREGVDSGGSRAGRWLWPLLVVLATAAFATIPAVLEPEFYLRGDSAAQFAPTWWYLGTLLRRGEFLPLFDPGSFAGGNYAAETLFGVYNPVNWLIWLVVSGADDLRVSVTAVKVVLMALLALGTYVLAREYGAARWASAAVAVALPFSGFTLFWDAGSWTNGLVAFTWTPWMWWALRRTLHGRLNPFWGFLVAAMAVLQGNPYGTLAVVVVGVGLVLEGLVLRRWRGLAVLAVVGACVAALLPLVYLPLVETVSLAARAEGALVMNNGRLRPTLADLLLAGSPTHVPPIAAITGPMAVPATYWAWFVVPLLPWLRLDALRGRLGGLTAVGVAGLVWFAMTVGPSKLWLFRWPLRLSEYLFLCLSLVLAVVLSRGLARDRVLLRGAASAGLVLLSGWLALSEDPELLRRVGLGTVAVLALALVALAVHRLAPARLGAALLAGVLVLGTGATTALQVRVFGENASSRVWHMPTDVAGLQARFADWGPGTVVQIADLRGVQERGSDERLRAQWSDYLAGSMFHVAGVDAVNNYTGMGLETFTSSLCMNYDGLARACGYERLWQPVGEDGATLADQLKLSTVVTQPQIARGRTTDAGWTRDRSVDSRAVVLRRDDPLPWPDSRLAQAPGDVAVVAARSDGPRRDEVELRAPEGGTLVFATLGWPGYEASLDGRPVPVGRNEVGLLEVDLPPGSEGTLEVAFTPPGQRVGLLLAGLGTLLAAATGALVAVLSRRQRRRAEVSDRADASG